MISGYGICVDTTKLAAALLNILNILSIYLSGHGTGAYANFTHAWAMVYILNITTGVCEWMLGKFTSSYKNNFDPKAVKWVVNRIFENI